MSQICLVLDLAIRAEVAVEHFRCFRRHLVVDMPKHRMTEVFFSTWNGLYHLLVYPEQARTLHDIYNYTIPLTDLIRKRCNLFGSRVNACTSREGLSVLI